jgi:hypothetical protein
MEPIAADPQERPSVFSAEERAAICAAHYAGRWSLVDWAREELDRREAGEAPRPVPAGGGSRSWAQQMAEAYSAGLKDAREGLHPLEDHMFWACYGQGYAHGAAARRAG